MIDVIIPVLNEEGLLLDKKAYFLAVKDKVNLIFVDGGSADRTEIVAQELGAVVKSCAGRSLQKNEGARHSSGEFFLFMNADTEVLPENLINIQHNLEPGIAAACFTLKIAEKGLLFRLFEVLINARAKFFGIVDADLGLLIKRDIFIRLGGFDRMRIMDDIAVSSKIKTEGNVKILPYLIHVSARKWQQEGFCKTFWAYTAAYLRFWFNKKDLYYAGD